MNIQQPREIHTHNLILGKSVTGPYEIKLNGEGFHAVLPNVFVGCVPPFGCWQDVGFSAPEEALITKTITAGLPLDFPPGKYPITGDNTGASAAYLIGRKTPSGGWYISSYTSREGTFTLIASNEETHHMHGSFEFVVMIEGQRQTLSGKFNIKDSTAP